MLCPGMVLRDCVWLTDTHTLPFSPTHLYVHSEQRPHKEQTGRLSKLAEVKAGRVKGELKIEK